MHVSVVIPAHNTLPYIGECIRSIEDQCYTDWDIVVVDDCSTDGLGFVLSAWPNITQIRLPRNQGVTNATHLGILHAQGPIITIVDSDDVLKKISLAVGVKPFEDPDVGFVWTRFVTSSNRPGWSGPLPQNTTLYRALMSGSWWRASHQRFFRKSTYLSGIPLNPSIDRSSDFQLALLIASSGCKCIHVPEVTYWYRVRRRGSLSLQGPQKQKDATVSIRQWVQQQMKARGLNEPVQ